MFTVSVPLAIPNGMENPVSVHVVSQESPVAQACSPLSPYRSCLDNKKLSGRCSVAMPKSQPFPKWLTEEELLPSDLFFLCVWWICSVHFTKEALAPHRVCVHDGLRPGKCRALSS